jgi:cytochrome b561
MTTQAAGAPLAYSAVSKWVHWITALCVIGLIPAGIIMNRLPEGELQDRIFDLHRSTGILVLTLAVLRVLARRFFGVPRPVETLTRFERIASTAAHHSLLALIFIMPLLGWLMMSAYGVKVPVFGLFDLPKVLPESESVYKVLAKIHQVLGYLMGVIIAAHAGAALLHAFVKRDGVLDRMLPQSLARLLPR